jgi:hypothetical protein
MIEALGISAVVKGKVDDGGGDTGEEGGASAPSRGRAEHSCCSGIVGALVLYC